jgi:hydrogenase maturation protease
MPSSEKKILVVGYGNTLRSDDGIGQIISEKIEELQIPNVETLALHQLTPDLAGSFSEYRGIVFIDASEDMSQNEVQVFDLFPSEEPAQIEHAMSPQNLLRLARDLYSVNPSSCCVVIPARNFEFSEELSPLTKSSIEPAINIITAKIKNIC